ncbi:UNVERIFIED_CONTAM: hypothetical protein Sangu_2806900 [Sesamum angustifolium]|uniref:Retrovirus-related Pol polyprotein from transposon TNT 1-94-like beta-barrel domain-containing protein n=1 Tax=Sesamum angustifolium TaxID=2727405 RepID=A0AAW2ISK9_9LAMI
MGLNDDFGQIRNQVLVMDLLPSIAKAYSMLLRVEKQKQVQIDYMDSAHSVVLRSTGLESSQGVGKYNGKFDRKNKVDKRSLFCGHCKKTGHAKDNCFKLHGYPDWYKDLLDQKMRHSTNVHMVETNGNDVPNTSEAPAQDGSISEMIRLELIRTLKGLHSTNTENVHMTEFQDFAGIISVPSKSCASYYGSWIIDSGATNHVCADRHAFHTLQSLYCPSSINLPDGSKRLVTKVGDIRIASNVQLKHVLFVPKFQVQFTLSEQAL